MPNWCMNSVTFKHAEPEKLREIVDAWNSGQFMGTFLPCPKALKDTVAGCAGPKGSSAQLALEAQEQRNFELHGAKNWYEWQIAHWGTKWDFGKEQEEKRMRLPKTAKKVSLSFNSAWSPPIEFYEHMRTTHGFDIKAYFFEPGVSFCGVYDNGNVFEYDVPETPQEAESNLPAELEAAFGIIEFLEMNNE